MVVSENPGVIFFIEYNLGYVYKIFITDKSRHGRTMVRVDIMTLFFVQFFCQYQFVFALIKMRHSAFTTSPPDLLTLPFMIFLLEVCMVQIIILPHNSSLWLYTLHWYNHIYLTVLWMPYFTWYQQTLTYAPH